MIVVVVPVADQDYVCRSLFISRTRRIKVDRRGPIQSKTGVAQRVQDNYSAEFSYDPALIDSIVARCQETATGARNIDHILTRTLLPELAGRFLERMADGETVSTVSVGLGDDETFTYEIK